MGIGAREIMILLVIALLLFGASRLPTLARSLGRSARILKAEAKGLSDESDNPDEEGAAPPAQQAGQQAGHDRPQGQQPGYDAPPPAQSAGYARPQGPAHGYGHHQARPVPRASLEGPAARSDDREELPRERPATDR
ncbi:twin-arginine translocase TatA/TatE family subunit [Nocardiopsis sp. CT-R113]|uniref:Sec-independent protein translocase protein TatA n=1 Tax=Nocardiopsis codii TaxID=3065942 RepID=A0ABU7K3M3_9ACTN|nr:twin-arginine translocase TatA/TatE family subunit [Nocardiopsis sp. CT-R113]MEE2036841.1 twin-arginine translocase TatA/TatE family subunit [Nocardiopsis sp. CT-R113]